MKKFIVCYDIETKNKLEYSNYTLINEVNINNKVMYIFLNNGEKMIFDKQNISYTDKMFY